MKKTILNQQATKLKPIEQREFPLLRRKQQNNSKPATSADIEYLLEFVHTNQVEDSQQLKLIQNCDTGKQQQQQQQSKKSTSQTSSILDSSTITTYIVENTNNKQGESLQQRFNLISFIDLGLKIIAKVKKLMVRKKPQIKNNTKLSQQNQFCLIKDLFFPPHNTNTISTIKQQPKLIKTNSKSLLLSSQPQQMRQLRLQRQKDILLHRLSPSNHSNHKNNFTTRYNYLLTSSLYEQLMQNMIHEKDVRLNTQKQIDSLEEKLEKLNVFHQRKQQRSSQHIMINQIWAIIEQVSAAIKINGKDQINNNNLNKGDNYNT